MTLPDLGQQSPRAGDPPQTWQRLDPRMLLVQPLVELTRALPILLPLLIFGRSGGGPPWSLVGAGIVAGLAALRWVTTTYRVTAQHVQVRKGLFRRTTRTVPRDRIRTVDVTAHLLHRALGLARVAAGTGRTDRRQDEGITLDGLTVTQAARLRELLLDRSDLRTEDPPAVEVEASTDVLARLDLRWVRFAPFTVSGLVAVLGSAGVLWNLVSETHLDPAKVGPGPSIVRQLDSVPLMLAVTEVALALLVVVSLAAVVGYLLTFWGFRLARQAQGSLHVTRGLLTTRATTIEGRRLRGAELSEPLLLRAVGAARTLAITTGLRVGRGAERGGTVLLPPAPRAVAYAVTERVLGSPGPVRVQLIGHGMRAIRRRYTRAIAGAVGLIAAALVGWWAGAVSAPAAWTSLVALPVAIVLAADRARSLGHALVDSILVARSGSLARRRVMLTTEGVIGWNLRSTWFQRRVGLVSMTATTAAGRQGYQVLDIGDAQAVELAAAVLPALVLPFAAPSTRMTA